MERPSPRHRFRGITGILQDSFRLLLGSNWMKCYLIYTFVYFVLIYIYMLLFSNSYIRVQCCTIFSVHICCRLTLIRLHQVSNGRTGNFGPKPCNPCINRWIAEFKWLFYSCWLNHVAFLLSVRSSSYLQMEAFAWSLTINQTALFLLLLNLFGLSRFLTPGHTRAFSSNITSLFANHVHNTYYSVYFHSNNSQARLFALDKC